MKLVETVLTDAHIVEPSINFDERGYFYESFNSKAFDSLIGKTINFVQDNQSLSSKGTLRGLHFQQHPTSQSKLVRVIKGSVFDVAVDLRYESPTYKKSFTIELSEKNNLQFFIPKGFAHGFLALEEDTILSYKVDNYYSKIDDRGIKWDDPDLSINWPDIEKKFSARDCSLPFLKSFEFKDLFD